MKKSMSQEIKKNVFKDQVELLNNNLIISVPGCFFASLILLIGLYNEVSHSLLFSWFAYALALYLLHFTLFIINRYHPFDPKLYSGLLTIMFGLYGLLWAAVSIFLMPAKELHQMLVAVVIIGVVSGGMNSVQPIRAASFLSLSLCLLPLSLYFFSYGIDTYYLLGLVCLLYYGFMMMFSWLGNSIQNNNFRLKYENLELVKKLSASNSILEESELRFRTAFDDAAIGMAIVSLEGRWLKVNKSLCRLLGYSADELLVTDFQSITYQDDLDADLNYVRKLIAGKIESYSMEKRYIRKDGRIIWILLSVSLIRNPSQQPLYFISQLHNIDGQKKAEQELKYIAYHDMLTDLPNRKKLEQSFELLVMQAKRSKKNIALLFLDLDGFKEINDNYGHYIGDLLLKEVALRLKNLLRSPDIIARLGGDEFIIVLSELTSIDPVQDVVQKILNEIALPMVLENKQISITASIGISLFPENGDELEQLIKQADKALYRAKSEGKNKYKH